MSPIDFLKCVRDGGKVRTIDVGKDSYMRICYHKGKVHKGEVMKKKSKTSTNKYSGALSGK
jgi:hypothetical protein